MKKIAVTLVLLYCFFVNTVFAESLLLEYDGGIHNYTGDVYSLVVNGKKLENLPLNPIIFNDRALVPVREVFEALGATVTYISANKSVKVIYGTKKVVFTVGSKTALVNGVEKHMPDGVGAKFIAKWGEYAKTMVPVRFVSESIGLEVGYDGENKIISVTEKNPLPPTETPITTPTPTQAPGYGEEPTKLTAKFTSLIYEIGIDVVTITVTTDSAVSSVSKANLTASGTVYADIYGARNTLKTRTDIGEACVMKAIRIGQHDEYTRIAIDTENVAKYSVETSPDMRTITFKLSGNMNADFGTPAPIPTPPPSTGDEPIPTPTPTPTPKPMKYDTRKIVVLDAGHGGRDPGASGYIMTEYEKQAYFAALESPEDILSTMPVGSGSKIDEKDIALKVVHKVRENLEANGIEVILTRDGDTYPSLDSRPELANETGAVIFVSIHLNATVSAVTSAKGIEVYYSTQNNGDEIGFTSQQLAGEVLDCVIDSTNAKSRGVKSGNLLVNRKCMMPSALVEIGFMNNPIELELMVDEGYQDKLAMGIARGIISMHQKVQIPKEKEK